MATLGFADAQPNLPGAAVQMRLEAYVRLPSP